MSRWLRAGAGIAVIVCVALSAGGCATQAGLRKLRRDQREVRALLADNQVALDSLRRRVDVIKAEVEDAKRRPSGGGLWNPMQLERRVTDLEQQLAALGTVQAAGGRGSAESFGGEGEPGAGSLGAAGNAVAREENALRTARVDDTYREAFGLLRRGEYGKAVPRFREFLRRHEDSEFADDAQFWIGECYYDLGDYNRSILEFNEVLLKYPRSERVPGALLRQALAFSELGDNVDARLILQKLVSEYPQSPEAQRAGEKLQALGQ